MKRPALCSVHEPYVLPDGRALATCGCNRAEDRASEAAEFRRRFGPAAADVAADAVGLALDAVLRELNRATDVSDYDIDDPYVLGLLRGWQGKQEGATP
jgi:hypothetical protein